MNYRTKVSSLIPCVQKAAIHGFCLRVVAAGSAYATFELTEEEFSLLSGEGIYLELDV